MNLRWENHYLTTGVALDAFWSRYLGSQKRLLLFILGIGFDPRALEGIKKILSHKGEGNVKVIGLRYFGNDDEVNFNSANENVNKHIAGLNALLSEHQCPEVEFRNVILRSKDDKHIASINATRVFNKHDLEGFSDIVVDVSAMPRGIFIPIINKLLSILEDNARNLHVFVTENPRLDSRIQDRGSAEEATFINGFTVAEHAFNKDQKKVWIPILGESQTEQFDLIRKSIDPVETCIVVPFPSKDLKRGDEIIDEYKDLLFNDPDFDPRNIVYVFENNPFNVYRCLTQTIARYRESFALLEGCKIVVSALSSKLLTIGAFLAVYEAKKNGNQDIGIKQVESMSHKIEEQVLPEVQVLLSDNQLVHMWLTGEPYLNS